MRREYDFSRAQRNPHAKRLTRALAIRLDEATVQYFESLAQELGIPYRSLINLYLRDCATAKRKPTLRWKDA